MLRRPHALTALLLACGPTAPMDPDLGTSSSSSTAVPPAATGVVTTTSPVDPTTSSTGAASTTAPASSSGLDASTSTTIEPTSESNGDPQTFIFPSDFSCLAARGAGSPRCTECDTFTQDCPVGEKCSPWANDGGNSWNAHKCVPLDPNPDHAGDPCTVEGSGVSGLDSCDLASMCWDVDDDTLIGHCVPFCAGSPDAPECEDPGTACLITNDGALALCLPSCDPLLLDCMPGEVCVPNDDRFVCVFDAANSQALGPCGFINDCAPGLACLPPAVASECDPDIAGCCTPFCDLTLPPDCPGAMQVCTPWFEMGQAPPEFMNVGVCALP